MASDTGTDLVLSFANWDSRAEALAEALAEDGYRVTRAESAAAGAAGVIVMDVTDGAADAAAVREMLPEGAATLLICTPDWLAAQRESLSATGLDCVVEPFSADEVRHRLRVLRQSQALRERNHHYLGLVMDYISLATLGTLAAGIAHTYNNMLGVVVGRMQMIQRASSTNAKVCENAEKALNAARRMSEMSNQLLSYAKKQRVSMKALDLAGVVAGSVEAFRGRGAGGAPIEFESLVKTCTIKGMRQIIEHTMQNVLANAAECVREDGRVSVKFDVTSLPAALEKNLARKMVDDFACIAISYDGPASAGWDGEDAAAGIEQKLRCAAAEGAVRAHYGALDLTCTSARTTVRMFLPCYG